MSAYLTTERTTCPSPWRAELAKAEPGGGVGGICVNLSPKLKHRAKRTNGLAQSAPCGLNSAPKGLRSLSAGASVHGCPLVRSAPREATKLTHVGVMLLALLLATLLSIGLLPHPVWAREPTPPAPQITHPGPGDVLINEFVAKDDEWVELYNASSGTISLDGWYIDDDPCEASDHRLGAVDLSAGDYHIIEPDAPGWSFNKLSGDGETLYLCDARDVGIDRVAYGVAGGAPVPPKETATARTPNGTDSDDHARDWNIDHTPTPGRANDAPPVALGRGPVINEVNNYALSEETAIEFYNPLTTSVSIAGWLICDGDKWGALEEVPSIPAGGLLVIDPDDVDVSIKADDVLYFFRPDGTRVDQVGFTYEDWDNTFQRVPNGAGPNDGYDWDSTSGGVNWLYLPETLGRINVPPDGLQGGDVAWPQNRLALGHLTQTFKETQSVCTTADIILAGVAAGFDPSLWESFPGRSPLNHLHQQVRIGGVYRAQDLSCAILAAVATGQDPRSFGGRDLVRALLATQDSRTGQFGRDVQSHAYAILALHNAGVTPLNPPVHGGKHSLSQAVAHLRSLRGEDGAWSQKGSGVSDTETTALVIQALLAAGEVDPAHATLAYLRRVQNSDGGFGEGELPPSVPPQAEGSPLPPSVSLASPPHVPSLAAPWHLSTPQAGGSSPSTTALAIQALNAMGEAQANWTPDGTDPVGALLGMWDAESKGYVPPLNPPQREGSDDIQATARAIQALEGLCLVAVDVVAAAQAP